MFGGCHLNREIDALVTGSGLELTRLDTFSMRGPKVSGYMFEGVATKPWLARSEGFEPPTF